VGFCEHGNEFESQQIFRRKILLPSSALTVGQAELKASNSSAPVPLAHVSILFGNRLCQDGRLNKIKSLRAFHFAACVGC
jgi:hypothetical protein